MVDVRAACRARPRWSLPSGRCATKAEAVAESRRASGAARVGKGARGGAEEGEHDGSDELERERGVAAR